MGSYFWVSLLLITELILLVYAYSVFKGDIISPSIVTLVLFSLSTVCWLYGLSDWKNVYFTGKGYLLFALSFILMVSTERFISRHKFVFGRGKRKSSNCVGYTSQIIEVKSGIDIVLFLFLIFCALLYIYRVYATGMSLGAAGLLASIGVNKEEGDYDTISRLLYNILRMSSYVYAVIVCNNIFCCKDKIKNNIKGIIIIILTVLATFFSGQRSTAICYVAAIIVAMFISIYDARRSERKINVKKFVRRIVLLGCVVLVVFFLSANIVKATSVEREFIDYMTYYFGSTTALMGTIVEEPSLCHEDFVGYFGEKTFQGFWNDMYSYGIVSAPPAGRRWINLGSHITNRAGNEYTFLCGPYIDFGFIGTLIFIIVFYAVFSYIYYWLIKKKRNTVNRIITIAIYIFLYAMVAMSFYQDTIRTYTRLMNVLYVIYIVVFCKLFIVIRKDKDSNEENISCNTTEI